MFVIFVSKNQKDWDDLIFLFMMVYRLVIYEVIGVSFNEMVFGCFVIFFVDLVLGCFDFEKYEQILSFEYVKNLFNKLDKIYEFVWGKLKIFFNNMVRDYNVKI